MHFELLLSNTHVAIFSDNVGPRLHVVRVVVIRRRHSLLRADANRTRQDDNEDSNAQQNPTMNEAAYFHVLILSRKPLRPSTISSVSALRT